VTFISIIAIIAPRDRHASAYSDDAGASFVGPAGVGRAAASTSPMHTGSPRRRKGGRPNLVKVLWPVWGRHAPVEYKLDEPALVNTELLRLVANRHAGG
jgi:hypothetical protein